MANLPPPAPLVRALLGITLVLVVDGCREDAQAPTEAGAAPQLAVSGQPLSFRQVAAGSGVHLRRHDRQRRLTAGETMP